jgi:hypothetical protein
MSARIDQDVILGGRGLLALAVRTLVGAADELAFNEDVRALLDGCGNTLCELRTKHTDAVPLGFRGPFVLRTFPRALSGDGENGELCTVATQTWSARTNGQADR